MEFKMSLIEKLLAKVVQLQDGIRIFKPKKVYKPMVTSSVEEINLYNSSVGTRQVKRSKKRSEDKLTTQKGK